MNTVKINDGIQRVERPELPALDFIGYRVDNRRNRHERTLRAIHLLEMALNFQNHDTKRLERQNLVVKVCSAGFVLGNNLWFECAVAVLRNFDRQLSELPHKVIVTLSIPRVANRILGRFVITMTKLRCHLDLHRLFHQQVGELLKSMHSPIRSSGFR